MKDFRHRDAERIKTLVIAFGLICCLGGFSSGCFVGGAANAVDGDPVVRVLRRDAIHSIDHPRLATAAEADGWIDDQDPVLGVASGTDARAYPLRILEEHEVVNDRLVDGRVNRQRGAPIAATW
jgi:hypothetical protein